MEILVLLTRNTDWVRNKEIGDGLRHSQPVQVQRGALAPAPPDLRAGCHVMGPAGVGWGLQRELLSI